MVCQDSWFLWLWGVSRGAGDGRDREGAVLAAQESLVALLKEGKYLFCVAGNQGKF